MCRQAKELKAGKITNRNEMQLIRVKAKFRKQGGSFGSRDWEGKEKDLTFM